MGRKNRQIFVTSPVTGRFLADELTRRDPQLLVTSAILGGAESRSHIAPPKNSSETTSALTRGH